MISLRKLRPVDRSLRELEREWRELEAQKQRLARELEQPKRELVVVQRSREMVRSWLNPRRISAPPPSLVRSDLFEITSEDSPKSATTAVKPEKLVHYLSAGSVRSFRPLKSQQRRARNRFVMYAVLCLAALWILIAIIT
jgi:DNA gyrase/topoisomerase IV subunit A